MELRVEIEVVDVRGAIVNNDHSEDWSAFGGIGEATTDGGLGDRALYSDRRPETSLETLEEPGVGDARVDGEGLFTEGVVIDEVRPGGSLPTVGVGEELAAVSLVDDEIPVEEGGIVPVSVGVKGESSEDLKISVSKSRGDSHLPVLRHAQ